MKTTGDLSLMYVLARRVLLDTLEALGEQRESVILVGAQAVYLHTGSDELLVAPYTTDVDLAIDPALLRDEPRLVSAYEEGELSPQPTIKKYLIVQLEGPRKVARRVDHYNLDAIGGHDRGISGVRRRGALSVRPLAGQFLIWPGDGGSGAEDRASEKLEEPAAEPVPHPVRRQIRR